MKKIFSKICIMLFSIVLLFGNLGISIIDSNALTVSAKGKVNVTKASGTYKVTASTLIVRTGNSIRYKRVGTLDKGKQIKVNGKTSNGWYRFYFKGKNRYVSGKYLKKHTNKQKKSTLKKASGKYKVTTTALRVRVNAGTRYKKVGTLKMGKIITVNGKINNWYRFKYKGKNRYVSGNYLKKYIAKKKTTKQKQSSNKKTPVIAKTSVAKKTNQIVTVVGSSSKASVEYWYKNNKGEWKRSFTTNGHVGNQGVGRASEYVSRTPKGAFKLGFSFGTSNPGTKMPFKKITKNSYWISNVNDKHYNTWRERRKSHKSDEHLIKYPKQYKYGMVINYNTYKPIKGAGSAFFLHVDNGRATAGCVSIPESKMRHLMRTLKNNAYIVIVNNKREIANF